MLLLVLGAVAQPATAPSALPSALPSGSPSSASTPSASAASGGLRLCIFDPLGTTGPGFNEARDYALAMQKQAGVQLELKSYSDEHVAIEDFRTGQCDAVTATALRTRPFNPVAAAMDSVGATSIVRNGLVDLKSSYDVLREAIRIFSSPAGSKLMTHGPYEVAGIIPLGASYPYVNDRSINSVEAAAGKRIASLDHDKAEAVMIQRIGAQPVSADVLNFATKFNNGLVDVVVAPALVYKPLELYKGIGTKGAIARFPIIILTYQMIIRKDKFPGGYGETSRLYWLNGFDRALTIIKKSEADIPASTWMEISAQDSQRYSQMLREARIDIANLGIYDKTGLRILKRVRCHVNPSDPECSTDSEVTFK